MGTYLMYYHTLESSSCCDDTALVLTVIGLNTKGELNEAIDITVTKLTVVFSAAWLWCVRTQTNATLP